MKHFTFIIRYLWVLLLAFASGRLMFICHNHAIDPHGVGDYLLCYLYGFPQDLVVALGMLVVPLVLLLIHNYHPGFHIKVALRLYMIASGLLAGASVVADVLMYGHWKFKLDNCIWGYIDMGKAGSSLTPMQQFVTIATVIGVLLFFQLPVLLVPFKKALLPSDHKPFRIFVAISVLYLCLPIHVSTSYWSDSLFLNHVATNSSFNLAASAWHDERSFCNQFDYLPEAEYKQLGEKLYPAMQTNEPIDSVLNTTRPNILFIQLESCGAVFVGALGGDSTATPCLNQLAKEGVFFTQCYSNSFRTDRATVSALSGELGYPTLSLMLRDWVLPQLPSLAKTLTAEGYATHYQYGGGIEGMNKGAYIRATGYQQITSEVDYIIPDNLDSSWGANDSITFAHLDDLIQTHENSGKPWFITHQTISSHEPWDVPYHVLDNNILNAFAYTDHHLGRFIERIKQTPAWDNLLICIYSDHGYLYNQTFQDAEYFRIPMLWIGGAIKQPLVMNQFMNESDLPATVLGQLGISAQGFPFSRNVLSKRYQQHSFAFSTYPAGFMYADNTGRTMFDIHAQQNVTRLPAQPGETERIRKGQAILQYSYDYVDKLVKR